MQNLSTYLNDHLAGSVGALELIDHLIESGDHAAMTAFLKSLREEIEADQEVLKNLLSDLSEEESAARKAGAWILEKVSRVKLQIGTNDGGLGMLQALEVLSLGIMGKRALWRALAKASSSLPALSALDYLRLEAQAADQFDRVEGKRLEIAHEVLIGRGDANKST